MRFNRESNEGSDKSWTLMQRSSRKGSRTSVGSLKNTAENNRKSFAATGRRMLDSVWSPGAVQKPRQQRVDAALQRLLVHAGSSIWH